MLLFLTFHSACSFCVCFSFSHTGPDGERGSGRETELEREREREQGKTHNSVMPISEISRTLSDLTHWQKPLRDYNENVWQEDSGCVCVLYQCLGECSFYVHHSSAVTENILYDSSSHTHSPHTLLFFDISLCAFFKIQTH